ncbi:hypothetical protein O9H85_08100 [Paenibacillus filicis]|uniref:NlpC/P60 domain-containing protein n=1 Tax=Paenibacillus gyeongsangnamensis TaxID=3388067 RepID=A0ABT4Q696_9BACL|nr:hypothetical protein [Paenibacillus filicis]MCZ8512394.1 hypothetical protein [Paenibacillus filicis]
MVGEQMQIKPGDVLFVWGNGLIDHIIEEITDGPSHVALFVNDTTLCEAQSGREVGEIDLSFYMSENNYLEIWRDLSLTDDERTKMIQFAKSKYGSKYDYVLIPLELFHFEISLNIDWYKEHQKYICSTYINEIGKSVNRKWSKVANPAPIDDKNENQLTKMFIWRGQSWETTNLLTESA